MSNLYKTIDSLCAQNGTNITQMCKVLLVSRSTLSELKSGRTKELSHGLMLAIAEMFFVDTDFFDSIDYDCECPYCGLRYNTDDSEENEKHSLKHSKWLNAVKQYGFCWNYKYREYVKAKARNSRDDLLSEEKQNPLEIAKIYELIFKSLFSRSLEANDYSLEHPDFQKYCSGILGQKSQKDKIPDNVYMILTDKYGTTNTIPGGTYYMSDIPSAKKKTISKFTNDEKEHIKKYRTLDEHGQRMIDLVLNEEYNRCTAELKEKTPTNTETIVKSSNGGSEKVDNAFDKMIYRVARSETNTEPEIIKDDKGLIEKLKQIPPVINEEDF